MGFALLAACSSGGEALADDPSPSKSSAGAKRSQPAKSPSVAPEPTLGVSDVGIWSDLDPRVALPAPVLDGPGSAILDTAHSLLIVYADGLPLKAYPVGGKSAVQLGGREIALRPGDAAEISAIRSKLTLRVLAAREKPPGGDADGDGIPNSLDLLIGAKKTVLNAASYGAGYIRLEYPNGDVPREVGVCSDVIIRAVRNAGVDLQSALQKDIRKAKRSYPMVKKRNSHIDHRRVKTLLPYFVRHWNARSTKLDDNDDPLQPGDVIFMDTFPNRSGPDHIGVVSGATGESGHPLIINNWTDGSVTAEMDLLDFVPITHRFRMP